MVEIANILNNVISNSEKYLKSVRIWNEKMEIIFDEFYYFLDERREYESLGMKRFRRYWQMRKLSKDFLDNIFGLKYAILLSVYMPLYYDESMKLFDSAKVIENNFEIIYHCINDNNCKELEFLNFLQIKKDQFKLLPRSGQVIKFL